MDFIQTIRSMMPVDTIIPSKNIGNIRWRINTKFTQYLSTNPVLQKVYQKNSIRRGWPHLRQPKEYIISDKKIKLGVCGDNPQDNNKN